MINFFIEHEYTKSFKIKLLKTEKKVKETYTDAELKLLLQKPNLKKCSFAEYRNWVIINYVLATGNRIRTIANIKINDIDFNNGSIVLKATKNRHQQIVPISKTLFIILNEYLKYRQGKSEDYLFCDLRGGQLNTNGISQAISNYNRSRGVNKTSMHLFRHTFAKKWILNGGDIFRLQKLLGHKNLDMVKEYVEMFNDDLKKDFNEYNPLEEFSNSR